MGEGRPCVAKASGALSSAWIAQGIPVLSRTSMTGPCLTLQLKKARAPSDQDQLHSSLA